MADHAETKTAETPSSTAKPTGTVAAPAKPPAKASTEKADAQAPPDRMRRRVIWTAIGGYLGINFLMFLRFFFPRALYEPNTVFSIGYPADFDLGIDQRFLMTNRIWVVARAGPHLRRSSRAARIWDARRNGSPARTSSSARATAAATTRRRQLRGPGAAPDGPRAHRNSTPRARSLWIPAGCMWTIRRPASINSTIQARFLSV